MKILYIITKSEAGGAQTHVADLCRFFKGKGHDVAVLCRGGGWLEEECKKMGVNFVNNPYFGNSANPFIIYKEIKEINKCVAEFKPDIVHCHSSAAGFFGRVVIRNFIPTVYTAHGWAFDKGTPFLRRIFAIIAEKIVAKYCYKIICVSNFTKKSALQVKIAPDDKFTVVYNGVKTELKVENSPPKADPPLAEKLKDDIIKIIFVGRFSKQKNPILLLKAVSNLQDEFKNKIELTLIGDGPNKEGILNFIKTADSLPKVEIISKAKPAEVFTHLNESDLFVLTTNWEGFPYTILEAMSCSLPVIASDVGGVGEAVNELTGILVNNEVGQIREAVLKLVNDKELRLKLGKQGREDVLCKFSLENMLKEIEKIYSKIL